MTHPQDNTRVNDDVNEIRAYERSEGASSRDTEVEQAQAQAEAAKSLAADVQAAFDAHMRLKAPAGHPTEDPPPPPPPPPPTSLQVYGTSYGGADESKNHGRADVGRIFFQGNAPDNPFADADAKQAMTDGAEHLVFSWKGTQNGDAIKRCFDGKIPNGITAYGCFWHEPEDNIPGGMTLAQWEARHVEHQKAMREVGVIPVGIYMAYTLSDASNRNVSDYYVGDDGMLFDAYFNPAKGKTNTSGVVDKIVAAAKAAGCKFAGLGETGVPDPVDDGVTITLTKDLRAKLDVTPFMRVNCYWPSGDFKFISEAHANAWFTDPTPASLAALPALTESAPLVPNRHFRRAA